MNLVGLLPSELEDLAVELGALRYRGRQLATWIYRKSVFDLEAMTDLPKEFRKHLAERAVVEVPEPERLTPSQDGSRKLVFVLAGGSRISSVLMPDDERMTLCVSTQVGCGFACGYDDQNNQFDHDNRAGQRDRERWGGRSRISGR